MPEPQQQFDGQNSVPGYTLFQGKDGQNFYLKGENLADDDIRQRVSTLRDKAGAQPTAPAQATPEAIENNKRETAFEKENKPTWYGEALRTAAKIPFKAIGLDTNSQSPVSDFLAQNGKAALDAVNPVRVGAPKMVKDVVHGMNDTSREGASIWNTGRSVEPAAANETGAFQTRPGGPVQKLGDELEHPKLAGALRVAASMLPVVGPGAVRAGHQTARAQSLQEWGEGIAEAGGVAGQAVLATEPGQRVANAAIEKVGGPINRAVVKPAVKAVGNLASRFKTPEAQKALTQAIQPGVNIPRAQESIGIAGPRMQQVREATGREITNTGDALELNRDAKKVVLKAIEDRLGPVADLQPDTKAVGQAMRGSMDKITRKQYGSAAEGIDKRAAVYDEGGHTLRDIEERIHTLNNHLRNFYKQPTFGENPVSMNAEADLAEVTQLRQVLDSGVERLTGEHVADLKREYGAQRDVEKALARQHAVATRQKGAGLWEGLAYLHAAGDLASGNLMGAVKSAATLAAGKRLATLRNPNYLLKEAFHGKQAFGAAEPIAPYVHPEPHGLLPKPATEAGFTQEDASGSTRGGRYTTPAAQIEDKPLEAKFIREIPKAPRSPKAQLPQSAESLDFIRRAMNEVPPSVDEKFAREPFPAQPVPGKEWADDRRMGAEGAGGIRTTPRANLRGTSTEAAKLLIQQTLDVMRSGDRPGRYFNEDAWEESTTTGGRNWRKGERAGGHWMGVKSARTMLPWINENDFTPAELERALTAFDKGKTTTAMASAMRFVEREAARSSASRTSAAEREPAAEEEEGNGSTMPAYRPSAKAQEMSAPRQTLGPEFEAQENQEEINRNKAILRNPRATEEERSIAQDRLRDALERSAGGWNREPGEESEVIDPEVMPRPDMQEWLRNQMQGLPAGETPGIDAAGGPFQQIQLHKENIQNLTEAMQEAQREGNQEMVDQLRGDLMEEKEFLKRAMKAVQDAGGEEPPF